MLCDVNLTSRRRPNLKQVFSNTSFYVYNKLLPKITVLTIIIVHTFACVYFFVDEFMLLVIFVIEYLNEIC